MALSEVNVPRALENCVHTAPSYRSCGQASQRPLNAGRLPRAWGRSFTEIQCEQGEELWYFRELVKAFQERGSNPLIDEFRRTVGELETLAIKGTSVTGSWSS
jgi:hypothetical protein